MTRSSSTAAALDHFIERALARQLDQIGRLPQLPYDPEWPSDCYQTQATPGEPVGWRPVRQPGTSDLFARIGSALQLDIHPDIVSYYGRYWSDPLPARRSEGQLNLLQLWNPEDGERLRANLIGHVLEQARRKRPPTLFFACIEDDDLFISLDNRDGSIWLEAPGKKPLRQLHDTLADFLDSLQPDIIADQE
ncbi:SecY-interacting protein [Marinobacterium aestuariivivens]|uniref:Protein Syd n=1 Tax=Marinobacterium aestuariivivens TaxID=1698799 RepID=A0ABW1ZU34_9GAMM